MSEPAGGWLMKVRDGEGIRRKDLIGQVIGAHLVVTAPGIFRLTGPEVTELIEYLRQDRDTLFLRDMR